MDILNFISWIKAGNYRATLPTDVSNLIPVAAKDPSRDDGYLPFAVNAAPLQSLYNQGSATQITSVNEPVTLNTLNGVITTFNDSIASGATNVFTFINSNILSTSTILVSIEYSNGAGAPVVRVSDVGNGSCKILIANVGVDQTDGPIKIHFLIIA
jgi:hypothetical protein